MILYVKGNLLQSPAQVLVNTVNTVGVMGRGIALDFKRLFPEMYSQYRELCEKGEFRMGDLWLYRSPNKWILNFPTKEHWRYPSRVEYLRVGMARFVANYSRMGIHSIAFPALGCGNGQLDFSTQVEPLMQMYLGCLPIEVFIYPGRRSQFVEHIRPEEMSAWLRSEPQDLPFAEVWEDLKATLGHKQCFLTVAKRSPFRAEITEDPPGIRVMATGSAYHIHYDKLVSFWQQLRAYGFSMRYTAPGLDRQMSYILSVFNELDYVAPVHVAEGYENLANAPATGLQVLPSAFVRGSLRRPQYIQPSLFSSSESPWSLESPTPLRYGTS